MELTIKQLNALHILKEEKIIEVGSTKVNSLVMNNLYSRNLIKRCRYANGEFWEFTDDGIKALSLEPSV